MKREHILASLWMGLVTAFISFGWSIYTLWMTMEAVSLRHPEATEYLAFVGSIILVVIGIAFTVMAIIALVKSRKNEEYFANKKGFIIALLVLEAILVVAALFCSIYSITVLAASAPEALMVMGGLYLTHVFAFATYTTSFVLTLLSVIKANKKAEIEVVEE